MEDETRPRRGQSAGDDAFGRDRRIRYWLLQALGNSGHGALALAHAKLCWGSALNMTRGCFPELFSPEWATFLPTGAKLPTKPSLCHPWSSGVTPWLTRVGLGLRPLDPGYREGLLAAPLLAGCAGTTDGAVATPDGPATVAARCAAGSFVVNASAPRGRVVVVALRRTLGDGCVVRRCGSSTAGSGRPPNLRTDEGATSKAPRQFGSRAGPRIGDGRRRARGAPRRGGGERDGRRAPARGARPRVRRRRRRRRKALSPRGRVVFGKRPARDVAATPPRRRRDATATPPRRRRDAAATPPRRRPPGTTAAHRSLFRPTAGRSTPRPSRPWTARPKGGGPARTAPTAASSFLKMATRPRCRRTWST